MQTLVLIKVYLTQTDRPPPPALHRWAPGSSPDPAESAQIQGEPRYCPPSPSPGNEGGQGNGEGRRGTRGPSPSYLGSEPSAGKSMAGGADRAPVASPSASRSRAPELPLSIARRARGRQPNPPNSPAPPHSAASAMPTNSEVAPRKAEVPPRRWDLLQAPPLPLPGGKDGLVRHGSTPSAGTPMDCSSAGVQVGGGAGVLPRPGRPWPALLGAPPRCPRRRIRALRSHAKTRVRV